jgi:hypothetical protein
MNNQYIFKPRRINKRLLKQKVLFESLISVKINHSNKTVSVSKSLFYSDYLVLKKYYKNYIINAVMGVYFNNEGLKQLPAMDFGFVGYFSCSDNQLTSLEGCPEQVNGSFHCGNNVKQFTKEEVKQYCSVKDDIYV